MLSFLPGLVDLSLITRTNRLRRLTLVDNPHAKAPPNSVGPCQLIPYNRPYSVQAPQTQGYSWALRQPANIVQNSDLRTESKRWSASCTVQIFNLRSLQLYIRIFPSQFSNFQIRVKFRSLISMFDYYSRVARFIRIIRTQFC